MSIILPKVATTTVSKVLVNPIPVICVWEPIDSLLSDSNDENANSKTSRTSPLAPSYNQCFQGF
jgi:hypothetical protein